MNNPFITKYGTVTIDADGKVTAEGFEHPCCRGTAWDYQVHVMDWAMEQLRQKITQIRHEERNQVQS